MATSFYSIYDRDIPEDLMKSSMVRLEASTDKSGTTLSTRPDLGPCWLRTKGVQETGYALFWFDGDDRLAHRFSYEAYIGPIEPGLVIDHLCHVRRCVNPNHLEAVTQKENLLRSDTFQARNAVKTHCVNGHEFDQKNTYIRKRPGGGRMCAKCCRIRTAARRARQKELV